MPATEHQDVAVHHTQRRVKPWALQPLPQQELRPHHGAWWRAGLRIPSVGVDERQQREHPHGRSVATAHSATDDELLALHDDRGGTRSLVRQVGELDPLCPQTVPLRLVQPCRRHDVVVDVFAADEEEPTPVPVGCRVALKWPRRARLLIFVYEFPLHL